jgi:hypothetical protein
LLLVEQVKVLVQSHGDVFAVRGGVWEDGISIEVESLE